MQFFYDGQIRRYILQTIRLMSNFVVKYGDGTLAQVPVMYGDSDRQVANILRQNSENKINSAPRIAVYISGLEMDRERLADSTHVGKIHIRERDIDNGEYTSAQGKNYTVERLMPTPYKLTVKADIWTTSTEQKLQLLEQILMLFNPSLEIQTTDNYIDWTSLSVVNLDGINFSSRSVPVGTDSPIDIATLTFNMPIWISPPSKVKKLGVITNIIMNVYSGIDRGYNGYIEGFGVDVVEDGPNLSDLMDTIRTTIDNYRIVVYGGQAKILDQGVNPKQPKNDLNVSLDTAKNINWRTVFDMHPGKYQAGVSKIFLVQPNGSEVIGTVAINPTDESILTINWDEDTYPNDTDIVTPSRPNSPGTFDAVIDPEKTAPGSGLDQPELGQRYLIIGNIGGGIRETLISSGISDRIDTFIEFSKIRDIDRDVKVLVNDAPVNFNPVNIQDNLVIILAQPTDVDDIVTYEVIVNEDGPDSWKNSDGSDFIANTNDVIEWAGDRWQVVFNAAANKNSMRYLTNIYTSVQYKWNGVSWVKSFEGEYDRGTWRIEL
jgi:hypothetical protein